MREDVISNIERFYDQSMPDRITQFGRTERVHPMDSTLRAAHVLFAENVSLYSRHGGVFVVWVGV